MNLSIDDQLTEIYCFVDDFLKAHPDCANWRASNHSQPKFSDAEVLTIALMQGYFGYATLKRTYELVAANGLCFFGRCSCTISQSNPSKGVTQLKICLSWPGAYLRSCKSVE